MEFKAELKAYKIKMHSKIIKYSAYLTRPQMNMLFTLNEHFLLLDIREEMIDDKEVIVAYNLDNSVILLKYKKYEK